jgi:tetratricopeptide (TPR) repeat protein
MPTRVEILHTRERADRALRSGRPREALSHYWQLLESVKATRAHYESWMDGAVGAYLALNRTREAGYMLLGLRRYAEAQRHFPAAERPLEWALCAAKLGHHGDAARVLSGSGRPVLAALELEAAGASAAARLEWERVLVDPRLVGRPYETALGHFNLGEALLRIGDRQGGARAFSEAQRLLETAADDFETRGEPVRAFDCYSVLLRLGKATDSFENVSEGYLNAIRVLAAEDQLLAMQYYDDFLTYAVDRREWHAAAMAAREAANYSLRAGKPYDRHYLGVAVEAWTRAARDNQANDGPVDLSANALHAAIDAATALGDLECCGRLYAEMAELPIIEKRRTRYRLLAQRYAALPPEVRPPAVSFPEHLRRTDVYTDIWRQDLIELELRGDPTAVLARHVADHPPSAGEHSRQALRALLLCRLRDAEPARTALSTSGGGGAGGGPAGRRQDLPRPELWPHSQGAGRPGAAGLQRSAAGVARDALRRRDRARDPNLPRVDRRAGAFGGAGGDRRRREPQTRRGGAGARRGGSSRDRAHPRGGGGAAGEVQRRRDGDVDSTGARRRDRGSPRDPRSRAPGGPLTLICGAGRGPRRSGGRSG